MRTDTSKSHSSGAEGGWGQVSVVDFGWEPVWEPPPVPEPPPRPNGRALMRRWLAIATLMAAVGGGGWLAVQHYQTHLAGEQALQAAEAYALRLTDIDADDVDRNFADIADGSTGEFNRMHTRSGAKLRQVLIDNKATARGHVTEAVVKSADRSHAVVVLLVNQAVRNTDNPEPVMDRSRIRMTMDKVDGRWLASKVELV
ncbi:hypothetical protein GWR20_16735 [Mycolicibacter kumamotonensis]|uniref:Mce protein n=2 Tax=Mycolicibacter kumamotonensis TaxID=354243 RepID=A0A7K3LEN7_9MYCO|nr:hypothetical protein [Mycolicibacter kumamotonensis]